MKSNMKKILGLLMLGAVITACNDDDDKDELIPIRVKSEIDIKSRAGDGQDKQIVSGQTVSLFVTIKDDLDTPAFSNVRLTADGDGDFTYSHEGQGTIYYPLFAEKFDFYAVHPYMSTNTLSALTTFSVKTDQRAAADFYESDLMYADHKNVQRTKDKVSLTFHHKLSKITFKMLQEEDRDFSGLSSIEVMNVATTTQIDLATGKLTPVTNQGTSNIWAHGIGSSTSSELTHGAALIVPQIFPADQELLRVTLDGTTYTYRSNAQIVFEEEVQYNFKIKVYNNSVTFDLSAQDWDKDPDHI